VVGPLDLSGLLFLGPFHRPPLPGAVFFNIDLHPGENLPVLLSAARAVVEQEQTSPSRRGLYRRLLYAFSGPRVLILWDYMTRRNFLQHYVKGYHKILSTHGPAVPELSALGHDVEYAPYGYLPEFSHPLPDCPRDIELGFCGFLAERPGWEGRPIYAGRRSLVDALTARFGARMTVAEGVYGAEYNRFWSRCRVGVNRSPRGEGTLRAFEIMAAGAALVTDFTPDLARFFVDGRDLFFYHDEAQALELCARLLADPELAARVGAAGLCAVAPHRRENLCRRAAELALGLLAEREPGADAGDGEPSGGPCPGPSPYSPPSPPPMPEPRFA
jgi:hypothetical protein